MFRFDAFSDGFAQMSHTFFLRILLTSALSALGIAAAQQAPSKAMTNRNEGPGTAIVYGDGGGFMATGPKGWVMDSEAGQRIGTCCVFYPKGTTWDDADSVMYPTIVTKSPGRLSLKEFMKKDLDDFLAHNPALTFEDSEDMLLKQNKKAAIRYFYGVNKGSSEVVGYINEPKVIAVFVLSAKSTKALKDALPLFREFVASYIYMDVKFESGKGVPRPARQKD